MDLVIIFQGVFFFNIKTMSYNLLIKRNIIIYLSLIDILILENDIFFILL